MATHGSTRRGKNRAACDPRIHCIARTWTGHSPTRIDRGHGPGPRSTASSIAPGTRSCAVRCATRDYRAEGPGKAMLIPPRASTMNACSFFASTPSLPSRSLAMAIVALG